MEQQQTHRQLFSPEEYKLRCDKARDLQNTFLFKVFVPACQARNMEIEEINSLIPKLFLGIGDLLRDSLMTPEVFQDHLQAIGEDLLGRIDEYRRKIGDANWEKTVNAIAGIKALPRLEITEGDHQAEFTVPFPVKNTQLEPEHHSYIRYFPDLCSKQLEIEDNTLLQELQDRSRKVVGDICNT